MINRLRLRLLLLALLVAVSHVALISHVTAHFHPVLEQCELCVSQALPLAAIPSADHCAVDLTTCAAPRPPLPVRTPGTSRPAPYLQRAPPPPSP